ncbi:bifunctional diaminohydroxyphosphoribosylaminopyrimidine deaminase/5-amino-6-(5-phosphoribosylamino)uracil reductase RibD [Citromicrobium bathyomarinum]|uniref:bifunctional diaminohydroxyphosphoribosylaminopyrimidine deaminase/5-amino-6-(5-phosphoribosylamino)uracil reductase RibD n=1 Tax=Sphingomonadales TaxID=204457 RepID=UPI000C457195|nr:riboflavin biosynthesis protein RibD [Citromicrobium sp.]
MTPPTPSNLGSNDARWLAAAARLALRARPASNPNPGVGCLIVKRGRVIARGWTQAGGRPHAEAMALELAGDDARGADVFVTLEPCAHVSQRGPACADLLAAASPARVIVGASDPDPRTAGKGIERLRSSGIEAILAQDPHSAASLSGYLTRARHDRPHVTLKLALSLDGCIAMADGSSQWITGEAARAHVHAQRALADAILVGGGTWRADAPRLDVRLPGLETRSPQRWVLTSQEAPGARTIAAPAEIARIPAQYLYVEGGAHTAASFLEADLVDRLDIYRAPILIGGGRPALQDFGLGELAQAHGRWQPVERRNLGPDTFEAFARTR